MNVGFSPPDACPTHLAHQFKGTLVKIKSGEKLGVVFKPEDVLKGRKHMLEKAARDLAPGQVGRVEGILRRWDEKSEQELVELLGKERAKRLLADLSIV